MSYIINGKQSNITIPKDGCVGGSSSRDSSWSEPTSLERFNWLIYQLHARGEISNCNQLIDQEIKNSHDKNDYAYYQQGIILMENGKLQEALESFQKCYKLNPKNVNNVKQIGTCLLLLRRFKQAMEAFLEAEKTSEKPDWEIAHKLSECLLNLGDPGGAKDYARRAVQLGKQEISYALLMKILVETNDLRSAVAVSNAALECYPESPNMLTESALLHLRSGQTPQAYDKLNTVLGIEPSTPKALLAAGCIIQNAGDHDGALIKYKMAVSSIPNSVSLWNNIGLCFYSKQKYVASYSIGDTAYMVKWEDIGDNRMTFGLSMIILRSQKGMKITIGSIMELSLENFIQAMSCLKRALWISPLNWRVLYNLGLVHLAIGQSASAFNSLCAAVNVRPDNGKAFMLLACSLLDLKDTDNATRALEQATALSADDGMVAANATLCAYLAGDQSQASKQFKKLMGVIDRNPNVGNEVIELTNRLKEVVRTEITEEEGKPEKKEGDQIVTRELEPDEV